MRRRIIVIAGAAALVAVLAVAGSVAASTGQRFPDVPPDHYAFEAVEWAVEVGVTAGYTDGTFKPERPLIKRHAVVFMERYYDEILQAAESQDFTRGDMMVLLKAINDGDIRDGESTAGGTLPGEGVDVVAARAGWLSGWFQAEVYRLLLEELGYRVSDSDFFEYDPVDAYRLMAEGWVDYWPNSWYPVHWQYHEAETSDGTLVGDHLTVVGQALASASGFLVSKSFADEYGVYTMDELNRNPRALAAFDATDSVPGNGVAEIFGCAENWNCRSIIENMIVFSGWDNIAQVSDDYGAMVDQAVNNVDDDIPTVIFSWSPSAHVTLLRPGDNVYWMGVDEILDDSNPANLDGGEVHSQRGPDGTEGYASISTDRCPSAADQPDGRCKLGWVAADIRVTANSDFLEANPAARALFEVVTLPGGEVALASAAFVDDGESPRELAIQWIADNRDLVDEWVTTAMDAA